MQAIRFKAGSGSEINPYVVERGIGAVQQIAVPGNSAASVKIMINGKLLSTDEAPFIRDGSVMVPFKAIVEALGGKYSWDNESLMAMGGLRRTYITLMTDSPQAVISKITPDFQGEFNLQEGFNYDNFGQYVESNLFITMTVPPTMKNKQMMVPVRFVAESLGAKVEMDDKNHTVRITAP